MAADAGLDGMAGMPMIAAFAAAGVRGEPMTRDPAVLPAWAALLPVGLYLVGIAVLHLRRRPSVVAGAWDLGLLGASVAALAIAGPLDMLLPVTATGPWRLVLPAVGFAVVLAGGLLASRPRLVIYNITLEQLRPLVVEIATALDPASRWAGETVALPGRGMQVHLDCRGGMRTVSLVGMGSRTDPESWTEFGRRLRQAVGGLRVRRSPWAWLFAGLSAVVVALGVWLAFTGHAATRLRPAWPADASHAPHSPSPASSEPHHAGPRRSLDA
jgi:hypothetical protein